jgi:hypothetical protein
MDEGVEPVLGEHGAELFDETVASGPAEKLCFNLGTAEGDAAKAADLPLDGGEEMSFPCEI